MLGNSSKILGLSLVTSIYVLSGCSGSGFNTAFTKAQSQSANSGVTSVTGLPTGTTCTDVAVGAITRLTKIIFVVDTSGSNSVPTSNLGTIECDSSVSVCTPATDPTKSFRGGAIQNFFNAYQAKANFQWSFITFAGTKANSLINQNGSPYVTNIASQFQTAINSFNAGTDADGTPYQAALQLAQQTIQNDRDLNAKANPQYFVIFLTDGFPTDYNSNGAFNTSGMQTDMTALLAAAPGRVHMSTVYYGQTNDPSATALLQNMASLGSGQFVHAADTSTAININDVIPGSTTPCN